MLQLSLLVPNLFLSVLAGVDAAVSGLARPVRTGWIPLEPLAVHVCLRRITAKRPDPY
jgi:hypothetical protein